MPSKQGRKAVTQTAANRSLASCIDSYTSCVRPSCEPTVALGRLKSDLWTCDQFFYLSTKSPSTFQLTYEGEGGQDAGGLFRDSITHIWSFASAKCVCKVLNSLSKLQIEPTPCIVVLIVFMYLARNSNPSTFPYSSNARTP